jgi:hypothetical protein
MLKQNLLDPNRLNQSWIIFEADGQLLAFVAAGF